MFFYIFNSFNQNGNNYKIVKVVRKWKLIFSTTNVTKNFGSTIDLNNVDISIYKSEIRGFIGENGFGKSTMAALMTGIHEKTSGSMVYKNEEWHQNQWYMH